ncbi:hypothetical protein LCGC14_2535120, partial [marine sediment metagenome]
MPRRPLRIVLTGFSGTGKSLVAPLVAQRLGWQVVDTDSLVEGAARKPITDIFEQDGETRFRELEREAVRRASSQEEVVVAAGGGVDPTTRVTTLVGAAPVTIVGAIVMGVITSMAVGGGAMNIRRWPSTSNSTLPSTSSPMMTGGLGASACGRPKTRGSGAPGIG